ncbi:MAG TPA: hypothetical protein VLU46_05700 [Thermoanaerobaculia bacterium]|nr:hypothetical protein [Thermoanaerobaculia bacterium]
MEIIPWLLDGDPAIRWQTLRDLAGASERSVERERRKVAREGWGARLLAKQDSDGRWAAGQTGDDGMYSPKWTSTTYSMLLLRDCGLRPSRATDKACKLLLNLGLRDDGGILFGKWGEWLKRGEQCVTGMVLSILRYFECDDARVDRLEKNLLSLQMDDGGWNCRRPGGATHSSMNTTISALQGLSDRRAQKRGREFLLQHRLFRSHKTGNVIKSDFTRLSFPPRWHYNILRTLDHFRSVGARRDERAAEAIELLRKKRQSDGRWLLENTYRGKTYFEMERVGQPSRWNTLMALRVLRWWDGVKSVP